MSHDKVGEKESRLRELREQRASLRNHRKPSTSDLRKKIATVKPKANKGGRRGR